MCVKLGSSIHRFAMSDKSFINIGLVSRKIGNDEIRYPERSSMHAEHIVAGRRKAVPESLETWRLIFKKNMDCR